MSTLQVVIADDNPRYRQSLAKLLTSSGMKVAAEAANGWAALKAVEDMAPDVVVLDLNLPGPSGEEVTRRLTACTPAHRVLVLSVLAREADVRSILLAGASGYFLKDGPGEEIVAGVRAVAAGESLFSPRIAAMLLGRIRHGQATRATTVPLSPRERQVLKLVAEGRSNETIGEWLRIDLRTARQQVSHIIAKLEVDNRVQAAVRAVREGLV
jgi:DNA-binding NarL/FixJ family response regulator